MVYLESMGRKQKAVLWAASTASTSIGRKKVTAAIEIDVRWENSQSDGLDADGETIKFDATVQVYQDVAVGSLLWLGELADWTATTGGLFEVQTVGKIPNLKSTRFRRILGLRRYSDTLPPI